MAMWYVFVQACGAGERTPHTPSTKNSIEFARLATQSFSSAKKAATGQFAGNYRGKTSQKRRTRRLPLPLKKDIMKCTRMY
jgi:hypothetical protein